MSALLPKADIGTQLWNVQFVPKADIQYCEERRYSINLVGARNLPSDAISFTPRPATGSSIAFAPGRESFTHFRLNRLKRLGTAYAHVIFVLLKTTYQSTAPWLHAGAYPCRIGLAVSERIALSIGHLRVGNQEHDA
jgi:hypothetical protein